VVVLLAVALSAVPLTGRADAAALSFEQTRICLDVANATEDTLVQLDGFRHSSGAEPMDRASLRRAAEQVETSALHLFRVARDSQYLVPWQAIDEFAAEQRFSGGYLSGLDTITIANMIHSNAQQVRYAMEFGVHFDEERATRVLELGQQLGAPSKIRDMCGKMFLGTS
jgi:hypothetical protein